MTPDAQLVRRAVQGDLESFALLIARYERSVLAVAWSVLHDLHAAEDVSQSAWLAAFRRLADLREPESFGPWLLQVARHHAIDALRMQRVAVGLPADVATKSPATPNDTNAWEAQQDVLTLVSRLPDGEQALIALRYFDGHSMADIARITGRPLGTVTKQLSRAVARLRGECPEETR